MKISPQLFE